MAARYEVVSGSLSFRVAASGIRKVVAEGQTTADIPPESVPWLLGAGLIRPARGGPPTGSQVPAVAPLVADEPRGGA